MVADGQVVLQAEGLQHHAVPHGEREPQLIVVVGWGQGMGEPQAIGCAALGTCSGGHRHASHALTRHLSSATASSCQVPLTYFLPPPCHGAQLPSPSSLTLTLTWGWGQSTHIWLDVRWEGWFDILAGGQVGRDVAPRGHGRRGVPWNRRVGVIGHRNRPGRLEGRETTNKLGGHGWRRV